MAQPTNETTKNTMDNMYTFGFDAFKTAMESGIRMQKDAFDAMTGFFNGGCTDKGTNRMETVATDAIQTARKNAEQVQKMIDDNCRHGIDMVRKNFDIARAENKDPMVRSREMFQNSFDMMRTGFDSATKTASQMMESCMDCCTKTVTPADKKAAK